MAREALSNGDKILSENYLQHADHFTRILNERESFRKEKLSEDKSKNNLDVTEKNNENSDKGLSEKSDDETEIQKSIESQVEIN